jgi:hypothetical protein
VALEFSETRICHQETSPTKEIADIQVSILVCVQYWWAGTASASLLPLFVYAILVSWCCQCLAVPSVFVRSIGELMLPVPHCSLCFYTQYWWAGAASAPLLPLLLYAILVSCRSQCLTAASVIVRNAGEVSQPVLHCGLCYCTQYWWAVAASASLLPLLVYAILLSCFCQCLTVVSACVRNIGQLVLPVPHCCLCYCTQYSELALPVPHCCLSLCEQHRFGVAASAWPLTSVGHIIGHPDWGFRASPPSHHKYFATVRGVGHNVQQHIVWITDSFVKWTTGDSLGLRPSETRTNVAIR